MQTFAGIVTQLRSVTVSFHSGSASSLDNETALRFGEHSLNLVTPSQPAIHPGDHIRVVGFKFLGTVRPLMLRNDANGYECGFVSKRDVFKSLLVGPALGLFVAINAPVDGVTLLLAGLLSPLPFACVVGLRSYATAKLGRAAAVTPNHRASQPSQTPNRFRQQSTVSQAVKHDSEGLAQAPRGKSQTPAR